MPERHDTGSTEYGHDGGGVEHETSGVPSHERGRKHPNTEHQSGAVSVSETTPKQAATHDESQQEGDRSKRSEELSTVGCVGFCDGTENLGLGEVSASRKQNIPSVGIIQGLEHVEDGKEHGSKCAEGPKDQQPGLVSESSGHKGDGQGKTEDKHERLETGWVEHEVKLWVSVEGKNHQERDGQHNEEHHAQRGGITTSEHVQSHLQSISQEKNRGADNKPFPTQSDDSEGNTGENGVGHGRLTVLSDIAESTNKGHRVSRDGLGDASGTSVLHRT